ncbi:hypothetical protein GFH48_06590 [Streptomyces fagopyri]|uniref:Flippase-like domain-containing protein n=1 Tax=Streptomyces fagopyri TaxID=2662397 RepID=A0A5Q0L7F0_9ACTN|nr:lysylphosphatidylglycerol synthase transmembrane domain-containing protein [Streptomyces fagopyri]QFZ72972.1 hypothetical protein GFH48_06590 [Streptomyces fagopyri]
MSTPYEVEAGPAPDPDAMGRSERAHRVSGFVHLPPLRRRRAVIAGSLVAVVSAELVVAAPYARRAADSLVHAQMTWLLVAIASETVSMMMFARLQRYTLKVGGLRVGLGSAVATVFAGNAVGATLPGGSLLSLTYRTRRMRSWGASVPQIGFVHAATGVLSTIALALLAGTGHILSGDSSQLLSIAIQIGAICILTSAALALVHHPVVLRRPARALLRLLHRSRRSAAVQTSADRLLNELAAIAPSARFWIHGLGLALFNWGGDFLCLLAVCHAVGAPPDLSTALFAYVAGITAASAIPLLPAGIGVLDAALVLTLHHGGMPVSAAAAANLLYRMITPGLVSMAGWALLVQQRRRPAHPLSTQGSGARDETPPASPGATAEPATDTCKT